MNLEENKMKYSTILMTLTVALLSYRFTEVAPVVNNDTQFIILAIFIAASVICLVIESIEDKLGE